MIQFDFGLIYSVGDHEKRQFCQLFQKISQGKEKGPEDTLRFVDLFQHILTFLYISFYFLF